jgi:hypothetical protein
LSASAWNIVVPDASVLLKWGLDPLEEDDREQVALLRKGVLVTADEAYFQKAGSKGRVVLLRDWSIGKTSERKQESPTAGEYE